MHQRSFTDQLSRTLVINFPPKRIISLVPSQTELLFDLGLDDEIIGVTKFCTYPALKVASKAKIGGTKNLDIEFIRNLKPNIIIANKEENDRNQIETLMQEFPVWLSDIHDLDSALNMITNLSSIVNRREEGKLIAQQIQRGFADLKASAVKLKVAYLIWRKPYMAAGVNTFIDSMLKYCGLENAITTERYPQIDLDKLTCAHIIMLSSEPYPFKQKHVDELSAQCPLSKVILVDGEMFSWYGSRLLKATVYFKTLITELNNGLI